MFAVLRLIPSEGAGGLFCVYDCVCIGVCVCHGKSRHAMPASCFLLIVISVNSLGLRSHCNSMVGIFSMNVASALENWELSGLGGAFPSRAEGSGVSAGWAVLSPSETPFFGHLASLWTGPAHQGLCYFILLLL